MSQSNSNLFSKLTEILSETAGAASGVKKEIEIIQMKRLRIESMNGIVEIISCKRR